MAGVPDPQTLWPSDHHIWPHIRAQCSVELHFEHPLIAPHSELGVASLGHPVRDNQCYYVLRLFGSNETAIFLKKLDVITMMTNTAGKIIMVLDIISLGMGIIITLVVPLWRENQKKTQVCEFITPDAFYRFSIPLTVVIVIVLVVTGFAVFRSIQIKRKNQEAEIEVGLRNTLNVSPNPDRIFTKRPRFSEPERETEEAPLGIVEVLRMT